MVDLALSDQEEYLGGWTESDIAGGRAARFLYPRKAFENFIKENSLTETNDEYLDAVDWETLRANFLGCASIKNQDAIREIDRRAKIQLKKKIPEMRNEVFETDMQTLRTRTERRNHAGTQILAKPPSRQDSPSRAIREKIVPPANRPSSPSLSSEAATTRVDGRSLLSPTPEMPDSRQSIRESQSPLIVENGPAESPHQSPGAPRAMSLLPGMKHWPTKAELRQWSIDKSLWETELDEASIASAQDREDMFAQIGQKSAEPLMTLPSGRGSAASFCDQEYGGPSGVVGDGLGEPDTVSPLSHRPEPRDIRQRLQSDRSGTARPKTVLPFRPAKFPFRTHKRDAAEDELARLFQTPNRRTSTARDAGRTMAEQRQRKSRRSSLYGDSTLNAKESSEESQDPKSSDSDSDNPPRRKRDDRFSGRAQEAKFNGGRRADRGNGNGNDGGKPQNTKQHKGNSMSLGDLHVYLIQK